MGHGLHAVPAEESALPAHCTAYLFMVETELETGHFLGIMTNETAERRPMARVDSGNIGKKGYRSLLGRKAR